MSHLYHIDVSEVADGNQKMTLKIWTQRKIAEKSAGKKQQFWGFAKDLYDVAEIITEVNKWHISITPEVTNKTF